MPAATVTLSAHSQRPPATARRAGHVQTRDGHGLPFTHGARLGADILAFVRELG